MSLFSNIEELRQVVKKVSWFKIEFIVNGGHSFTVGKKYLYRKKCLPNGNRSQNIQTCF